MRLGFLDARHKELVLNHDNHVLMNDDHERNIISFSDTIFYGFRHSSCEIRLRTVCAKGDQP